MVVEFFFHPIECVGHSSSACPESPIRDRPSFDTIFISSNVLWCPYVALLPQARDSPSAIFTSRFKEDYPARFFFAFRTAFMLVANRRSIVPCP